MLSKPASTKILEGQMLGTVPHHRLPRINRLLYAAHGKKGATAIKHEARIDTPRAARVLHFSILTHACRTGRQAYARADLDARRRQSCSTMLAGRTMYRSS